MDFGKYTPKIAWASTVGITLVFSTVIGLVIGVLLDKVLGTKPWLTLIFLIFGIIAGFRNIFLSLRVLKNDNRKNS